MREILFRGKRKVCDEWVYGFPFISRKGEYKIKWYDRCYGSSKTSEVYPESVGQFTGLTDKNGKKIFEGDVVLYPWNDQDNPERFTIKFKDGQFVASPVKETEDYWDFMVGGYSKEMEIIGNIHDNPELLENP